MSRLLGPAAVLIAVLAGGFFLVGDQFHFTRHYEGTIQRVYQESINNASTEGIETEPMLEIKTENGLIEVEVPLSVFSRARFGMKVKKRPFTNTVQLSDP